MSKNKVIKSVALNITVANDQLILKHVKRRNFSGYVKKLILEDIARKEGEKRSTGQSEAIKEVVKEQKKVDGKSENGEIKLFLK